MTNATTPKDEARLAKEPFKTKYPPSNDAVRDALKGWRPTRSKAYVLFERWYIALYDKGESALTHGLCTLDVEGRPEQINKIRTLINKGFRILDWGNFHFVSDPEPESAKKAVMYGNAWASLEKDLKSEADKQHEAHKVSELQGENDALKAKLAEFEATRAKPKDKELKEIKDKDAKDKS